MDLSRFTMNPSPRVVPSVIPPAPPRSAYRATVEHVDDQEPLNEYGSKSSSVSSLTTPSPSSEYNLAFAYAESEEMKGPVAVFSGADSTDASRTLSPLVPPSNFSSVIPGVYRSSFPQIENLSFLKTLGLKSILTLVVNEYSEQHTKFVVDGGIHHFRVHLSSNKDPFAVFCQRDMDAALSIVLERSNHPILVHCNRGKHRTGCVIGCLRKTLGWSLRQTVNEYRSFADTKARVLDERFIDNFDEGALPEFARSQNILQTKSMTGESQRSVMTISTEWRG